MPQYNQMSAAQMKQRQLGNKMAVDDGAQGIGRVKSDLKMSNDPDRKPCFG